MKYHLIPKGMKIVGPGRLYYYAGAVVGSELLTTAKFLAEFQAREYACDMSEEVVTFVVFRNSMGNYRLVEFYRSGEVAVGYGGKE